MKKSRIVPSPTAVASPTTRRLPLVGLLVDAQSELFELAMRSGLKVLEAMLERIARRSAGRGMPISRTAARRVPKQSRARWCSGAAR
jgi:hypothetical protein